MTVSYNLGSATATFANSRLLAKWKGSIYKLLFKEFAVYCAVYALISVLYRLVLNESQRKLLELFCIYIDETIVHIPLTFVLGFYVSLVVSRWWDQLNCYPWPDRLLYLIIHYVDGSDERSRMTRRTLARYLNLTTTLLTRTTSIVTKKRFPSLEHVVEAGLMTEEELKLYEDVKLEYGKFWVPLVWFTHSLNRAKDEGLMKDPNGVGAKLIMEELLAYRSLLGKLFIYDWVSIPVSYTQVVTLATYAYFIGCVFSRQFLDPAQKYKGHQFDVYVPIFTILQFMFYVGWLKVAESLINPWGEDDDDFEVNWFIDRHLQVSFAVVDDMHMKLPSLVRDKYFGETQIQVPYTIDTLTSKRAADFADLGSVAEYNVPLAKQRVSLTVPTSRRESLPNSSSANALAAFRSSLDQGVRRKSTHVQHKPFDSMEVISESPTTAYESAEADKYSWRSSVVGLAGEISADKRSRKVSPAEPPIPFIDSSKHNSQYDSNENLNQAKLPPAQRPELENLLERTPSSPDEDGKKPLLRKTLR